MKKLTKLIAAVALIAVCAAVLTGCGVNITGLSLPEAIELKAGQTQPIELAFLTEKEVDAEKMAKAVGKLNISWAVGDESVATVDENGTITAVAPGETELTVTAGEFTATVKISVAAVVEGIEAEDAEINTLTEGLELAYKLLPEGVEAENVSITVADDSILDIEDGKMTAKAAGETQVTITADDVSKTITVKVLKAPDALNAEDISVKVGKTASIEVAVGDAEIGKAFQYEAADQAVATVSEDGVVTGVAAGETTITVSNELGQSCEVKVTVTKTTTTTTSGKSTSSTTNKGTSSNTSSGSSTSGSSTGTGSGTTTPPANTGSSGSGSSGSSGSSGGGTSGGGTTTPPANTGSSGAGGGTSTPPADTGGSGSGNSGGTESGSSGGGFDMDAFAPDPTPGTSEEHDVSRP